MLPRIGTSNQNTATSSTSTTSMMPIERVGQQLADDQLPARERRDVQLLERAELLLADDRHRRQVGRHDEQQQREDARES